MRLTFFSSYSMAILRRARGSRGRVAVLLASLTQHRLHLLRAPAQIHHLTGEVHALLHQPQVLVLQNTIETVSLVEVFGVSRWHHLH